MTRAHPWRETLGVDARPRLLRLVALGSLALLAVLSPVAAGGSQPNQGQPHGQTSVVVQHEATVTANATSPARSHRLVVPGALLVVTCLAAIAARRMVSRDRRAARRRVEQFHVRLRGPPLLLVAS